MEFLDEKTGSYDKDNARVLKETRFRSASLGDESIPAKNKYPKPDDGKGGLFGRG